MLFDGFLNDELNYNSPRLPGAGFIGAPIEAGHGVGQLALEVQDELIL